MPHPYIRILVYTDVVCAIDDYGLQRAGDDVFTAARHRKSCPLFPLGDACGDGERVRSALELLGTHSPMNPQPRIKRSAVGPGPGDILLERYQWIAAFPCRTHGRNEGCAAALQTDRFHLPDDGLPPPVAPINRTYRFRGFNPGRNERNFVLWPVSVSKCWGPRFRCSGVSCDVPALVTDLSGQSNPW